MALDIKNQNQASPEPQLQQLSPDIRQTTGAAEKTLPQDRRQKWQKPQYRVINVGSEVTAYFYQG